MVRFRDLLACSGDWKTGCCCMEGWFGRSVEVVLEGWLLVRYGRSVGCFGRLVVGKVWKVGLVVLDRPVLVVGIGR